jgi:glycosyltransferase involved in cell wall biosynthesis
MKIALVAPVEERVPPIKYGGTELVVANLADGLVDAGHEVHLFATGDSVTKAILHSSFPEPTRVLFPNPADAPMRQAYNFVALAHAVTEIVEDSFDIVHNNFGWVLLPFLRLLKTPVITTLHGPHESPNPKDATSSELSTLFPEAQYVSISNSQRVPLSKLDFMSTVYNGIQVERFSFNSHPSDYVAFLGRMSPEKGPKEAILAAREAGVRIVMAAKIDAVDRDYFEAEIKPLIDGDMVKFIGEVDHAGKVELLRNARAIMALIQWDEPFGLFMVEAMACGTPVIAVSRGSVPEVIEDGKTGLVIGNTTHEAAEAIRTIGRIKRQDCRDSVIRKFSSQQMVSGYEQVYEKVIRGNALPSRMRGIHHTEPVVVPKMIQKIMNETRTQRATYRP